MSDQNLVDYQFSVYRGAVDATHKDGDLAGSLKFDEDGKVTDVYVAQEHRRRGVATGMWNAAHNRGYELSHNEVRSAQGDAWVKAVGGPTPRKHPQASRNLYGDEA